MKKILALSLLSAGLLTISIANPVQAISREQKVAKENKNDYRQKKFRDLAYSKDTKWFASKEAQDVADTVLAYQFPSGGWPKNNNWNHMPDAEESTVRAEIRGLMATTGIGSTIDNKATTSEMLFLANICSATSDKSLKDKYSKAFEKAFNYLIEMQYDNGGWPQFYPLKPDKSDGTPYYSSQITYNDDAMVNVMKLMRDIARNKAPYNVFNFSDEAKSKAQTAFDKGVSCILSTQIRKNGKLTVWCQQHDRETFAPTKARAYELPSFTAAGESCDILELLMGISNPSDEIINSVCAGVEWLRNHAIENMTVERFTNTDNKPDIRLSYKEGAPLLWTRYYDIDTEKPFFCDRDGIKKPKLEDIGYERRNGYGWIGREPADIIEKFPKWYNKVRPGNLQIGDYGFLYCHMSDRGEWTAYALSRDGYHFHDVINGDSIFSPTEIAKIEGGTRDAFVCRKHDGSGYLMVTTDMSNRKSRTWYNYGIDLLTSDDLINWESTTFDFRKGSSIFSDPDSTSVYKDFSNVKRVWAPQIFWDNKYQWPDGRKGGYMIYYSMWNPDEFKYDRMYYSYADESFTTLTQPKLLFDWGYATIDADINYVPADKLYHMMIKKEGGKPGIFTATSEKLTGPWSEPVEDDYVYFEGNKKCEGVSAFQLIGDSTWRVAYIEYSSRPKHYRICKADKNIRNFSNPVDIEGVNGPQHGSFMRLTKEEYDRLQAWSDSLESKHIAPNVNNPVFEGEHADPEVLFAEKTGRYYIYPTTDGTTAWKSHDFKVFSSSDLKEWKDEGVMFDLQKDCSWADWYAWAPCIIERKYEKKGKTTYKYFYYFVANKQIGVAVADDPAGPFSDALGHAMITEADKKDAGIKNGQIIDPDVFCDPQSGKFYIYWGNSFLAVSELADDMTSIVPGSTKVLISRDDKRKYNYNEGTYVFYRNGKYYFSWSENDTRSANYRVRYLISNSPTSFEGCSVDKTIILNQNPRLQIYGTGHHSVIQKNNTDEWYMIYHRFTRPDGIKQGWDAGYHREVCIDRLEFNDDGTIKPVIPTL